MEDEFHVCTAAYHVHYEKSLCTYYNLEWFLGRARKKSFKLKK